MRRFIGWFSKPLDSCRSRRWVQFTRVYNNIYWDLMIWLLGWICIIDGFYSHYRSYILLQLAWAVKKKQTSVSINFLADETWYTGTSLESGIKTSSFSYITQVWNSFTPCEYLVSFHMRYPLHRRWITTSYRRDWVVWFVLEHNQRTNLRSIRRHWTPVPHTHKRRARWYNTRA